MVGMSRRSLRAPRWAARRSAQIRALLWHFAFGMPNIWSRLAVTAAIDEKIKQLNVIGLKVCAKWSGKISQISAWTTDRYKCKASRSKPKLKLAKNRSGSSLRFTSSQRISSSLTNFLDYSKFIHIFQLQTSKLKGSSSQANRQQFYFEFVIPPNLSTFHLALQPGASCI